MAKSVFILSTPSQAFFLSLTPELVENSFLILTVKSDQDAKNILGYLCNLKWKRIYTWYIPKTNKRSEYLKFLFLRINLWKLKKSLSNIKKIFIGSYVNQYHLSILAEFENKSEIFLLYDGLQMISAAHFRKNGSPLKREHPGLIRLLAFKRPLLKALNYVSPVLLDVPENDSLYLIKSAKTFKQKFYDPNVILFVGQPISDKGVGLVGSKFYLQVLQYLVEHHPEKDIIYVAHPRESLEMLESISHIMRIKKLETIFEKYFLSTDRIPGKIYSFYSSVLLNLIFLGTEGEIISIRIPNSEISGTHKEQIKPIYDYFQNISSNSFRLIDVKDIM